MPDDFAKLQDLFKQRQAIESAIIAEMERLVSAAPDKPRRGRPPKPPTLTQPENEKGE